MEELPVTVADATVTPLLLNHPVVNFGYRIDCNGKSVFFTGDHEPWPNIYLPDDEAHADYQRMIDQQQAQLDARLAGFEGPHDVRVDRARHEVARGGGQQFLLAPLGGREMRRLDVAEAANVLQDRGDLAIAALVGMGMASLEQQGHISLGNSWRWNPGEGDESRGQ